MSKIVGKIVMLIVMLVVLLLTAKAWQKTAPTALSVHEATKSGPLDDHGQADAAVAVRQSDTPDLKQTQQVTDAHAADVQDAMAAID